MSWWWLLAGYATAIYVGLGVLGGVALGAMRLLRFHEGGRVVVKARLEGGPFDGDVGDLVAPPGVPASRPGELFCVRCARRDGCLHGGVHWWADERVARRDAKANHSLVYRYRFARDDATVLVYVYAELTSEGLELLERRREPVPV